MLLQLAWKTMPGMHMEANVRVMVQDAHDRGKQEQEIGAVHNRSKIGDVDPPPIPVKAIEVIEQRELLGPVWVNQMRLHERCELLIKDRRADDRSASEATNTAAGRAFDHFEFLPIEKRKTDVRSTGLNVIINQVNQTATFGQTDATAFGEFDYTRTDNPTRRRAVPMAPPTTCKKLYWVRIS